MSENIVLDYPTMSRQREENIQSQQIAYAEDVNMELNHIMAVYNQLVAMLTGEWGEDTGRIYTLIDQAISTANEALAVTGNFVKRSGDILTGQLSIAQVPTSDYNLVNKVYVDSKIEDRLASPENRLQVLEDWKDNLTAADIKLENSNFAATNINGGMTELFLSVSSGKATVAAAITDKGIPTAATDSFTQMASNIYSILTFNEGTQGATATSADIMIGKTAFGNGRLLVGTYVPLDTSDATIDSTKVLQGYVGYANGQRIVGTLVPEGEYPIYGTDTTNATASESDIAYGKTAYARGQLLVGTARTTDQGTGGTSTINTAVTEYYGLSDDNYDVKAFTYLVSQTEGATYADGTPYTVNREKIAFCTNLETCVSKGTLYKDYNQYELAGSHLGWYIETHSVGSTGLVFNSTTNAAGDVVYKKYRYSKFELGIPEASACLGIYIGAPGIFGNSHTHLLYIDVQLYDYNESSGKYDIKGNRVMYVYSYDDRSGGIIGNNTKSASYVHGATIALEPSSTGRGEIHTIIPANRDPYILLAFTAERPAQTGNSDVMSYYHKYTVHIQGHSAYLVKDYSKNIYTYATATGADFWAGNNIILHPGDLYVANSATHNQHASWVLKLNPDYTIAGMVGDNNRYGVSRIQYVPTKNYILRLDGSQQGKAVIYIYDGTQLNKQTEHIKTLTDPVATVTIDSPYTAEGYTLYLIPTLSWVSADFKYLYLTFGILTGSSAVFLNGYGTAVYSIDKLLQIKDGVLTPYVQAVQYMAGYSPKGGSWLEEFGNNVLWAQSLGSNIIMTGNAGDGFLGKYPSTQICRTNLSADNIVGVTYKGTFYSRIGFGNLTAGQPDVAKGKTFIGWQGYPETGTRED